MPRYRGGLPQLGDWTFVTDGGLETTLIFHDGFDLPQFAAFDLLKDDEGTAALRRYFELYAAIARDHGVGLVLESPTWRANPDWARQIGYTDTELDAMNRKAISLMERIREGVEREGNGNSAPVVISGCVGPQGDGYRPESLLTAEDAEH